MMDNYAIADQFSLLAKLMDIHGDNAFRAKSYASAAYSIEQLTTPLASIERSKIAVLKGIGASTARKIEEILDSGRMQALDEILAITPPGILEMLQVKGLGPKKIQTIWKDMGIESIGELLYACQENRLLLFKGFGAKTQENVREAIEFLMRHQDRFLYADLEVQVEELDAWLKKTWPDHLYQISGDFRRQCPETDRIEFITTIAPDLLETAIRKLDADASLQPGNNQLEWNRSDKAPVLFHLTNKQEMGTVLFLTSASASFLEAWHQQQLPLPATVDEAQVFSAAGLDFIPPCLRESAAAIDAARKEGMHPLIQVADIRGIIHSHSHWSDGSHSMEEMALGCIARGYEYLVISDHSRAAQYAGGLSIEKVFEQHAAIDALNKKLAPFRLFKGIECDILGDGSLDYPDDVLAQFEVVIASVHSNLKMSEEKAMSRLLKAIEHPCTTILGHPTGRLLLSRPGYPIDHLRIIEACAAHGVAIEINAHPRRLDLDWTWIPTAIEKGVMLSINPDAHAIDGFGDVRYGVLAAQKGGLTRDSNLSSYAREAFEVWLERKRSFRPGS